MGMSIAYSIGELASAADVPISTLRHYERQGLLPPDGRTESNYRVYGTRSLERLTFIRAAQASGLILADVKRLLALRDGSTEPCAEVRQLLERRLADTERRLADLRRVRAALQSSVAACVESARTGRCRVIDELGRGSPVRARKARSSREKMSKKRQP
jgi:DNA-binding transcriptional MerR regulator